MARTTPVAPFYINTGALNQCKIPASSLISIPFIFCGCSARRLPSAGLVVADGRPPLTLRERRWEPPRWHHATWKDLLFGILVLGFLRKSLHLSLQLFTASEPGLGIGTFLSSSSFCFLRNWKPTVPSEALRIRELGPRRCHPSLSFLSQLCCCHRRTLVLLLLTSALLSTRSSSLPQSSVSRSPQRIDVRRR